jgi:penicillin-binding protein 2
MPSDFFPEINPDYSKSGFRDKSKSLILDGGANEFFEDLKSFGKPKSEFLRPAISERRLRFVIYFFAAMFVILAGRSGYVQIVQGKHYRAAAEENRIRTQILPSWRGIIYDRNNQPLLGNAPTFSLLVVPADIPNKKKDKDKFYLKLSDALSITPTDLEQLISENKGLSGEATPILENLEHERAVALMVRCSGLKGVSVELGSRREYMNEGVLSLSHILGYEGKVNREEYDALKEKGYFYSDKIGKSGLEYVYEEDLRGKFGKKQTEVDATGREKSIIAKEDPQNGKNLVLSLDLEAQKKLEETMRYYMGQIGKTRGVGIAMDPRNGEIIALVNLPTFDNNNFSVGLKKEEYQNLLNDPAKPFLLRAVSGEYPPGSTLKPIIAAAALAEQIITPETTVSSVGGINIGEWTFPDWKAGGHGMTNVYKAIAESVNTFFYYIGGGYGNFPGLGVERIGVYMKLFGLGAKLGIDLPGEATGFVPTEEWKKEERGEQWYIGDTYHLSIGQGDALVTPLQVASYTSVFANGGTIYVPHLVKKMFSTDEDNLSSVDIEPKILKQDFISKKSIDTVRDGMRRTVVSGSARSLSVVPVSVAGKTGTAQWKNGKNTHAWFTGFAPFDNPEIVITVLVEEGGEGSSVAVPIARDFLKWYFGNTRN